MIIEIRRAGFINKGAELMLRACHSELSSTYPEAIFTMAPTGPIGSQPFRKLVDIGFYPKASLYYKGFQWGEFAKYVPRQIREMYGVILDKDVHVVIDAAGFAYSDQWGPKPALELANSARRWRKQGTKLIMMPQALGPYKDKAIRKAIPKIVDNADLVIAREKISYDHLVEVAGERENIKMFPDFTNLLDGVVPSYFDESNHRVCVVPNYRMVDKTKGRESGAYLPFMVSLARYLVECGAKPFVLVHEGEKDHWLASEISEGAGEIPVIVEGDSLAIKGILGACYATIGSRFHGLVSALSQGVPSLATSWSHKYQELFSDYGYPQGVLEVGDFDSETRQAVDAIINPDANAQTRNLLLKESSRIKGLSQEMWAQVFSVINS